MEKMIFNRTTTLPSSDPQASQTDPVILKSYYKSAIQTVESKLSVMNDEFFVATGRKPIHMLTSRIKSQQSIIDKMNRHGYPLTVQDAVSRLNDIAGVRAICAFEDDVYLLADTLLQHADLTLLQRKDFIASPKASGYRSLHLILSVPIYLAAGKRDVRVEVQLRTVSMDFWAGLEHEMRYKQRIEFPPALEQQILECAELCAELDDKMTLLQKNLSAYIAMQGHK